MNQRATLAAHLHIEGFDQFHKDAFDKRKVRAAFRKAGQLVRQRAQLNLALSGGGGNYPRTQTGALRDSINARVSRSGFMVKVMPDKTADMAEYYPAYLHYGVKQGGRAKRLAPGEGRGRSNRRRRGERADLLATRKTGAWRIAPRANYIADALEDENARVRAVLSAGFARALG